jgi:hypothetical protein
MFLFLLPSLLLIIYFHKTLIQNLLLNALIYDHNDSFYSFMEEIPALILQKTTLQILQIIALF